MDRPKHNPAAATAETVVEGAYTDPAEGTRKRMKAARAGAIANGRGLWLPQALIPALLAGIFAVAGRFAVDISAQTRELRAEIGTVRGELGELKGRLDGVDRRIDDLRTELTNEIDSLGHDMNARLGRIEAILMSRPSPPDAGP